MNVRFYSSPDTGDGQRTNSVQYVYAVDGGGGDVRTRTGLEAIELSGPRVEERFVIEGFDRDYLQPGDAIHLRTNDGHYVGILHDEDSHEDYVTASAATPGPSETFIVDFPFGTDPLQGPV